MNPNDTPLARLCRYYIACISREGDQDLSRFAASYGQLDYSELNALPFQDSAEAAWGSAQVQHTLQRFRNDRNRLSLYVGYPIRLVHIKSRKKNWSGYKLEPLLTFEYQLSSGGTPQLVDERPEFNLRCLGTLTGTQGADVIIESLRLQEAIGLSKTDYSAADFPEILQALVAECPHWPWTELLDPKSIAAEVPLKEAQVEGILNRAVLLTAERPNFTRGLESELNQFQKLSTHDYKDTALGHWLGEPPQAARPVSKDPIIEVVPLNTEQREAVRRSLREPLTVITGPPGTGKSQVVTSIVVNCAWKNQSVLVASKNNQAVDVVEARVNAIGSRPLLLRLGNSRHQNDLATYLAALLGAKTDPEDKQAFDAALKHYEGVVADRQSLVDRLNQVIAARNQLDEMSQSVESLRDRYGEELFRKLRDISSQSAWPEIDKARQAVERATRSNQPLLTQLIWPFLGKSRLAATNQAIHTLNPLAEAVGLDPAHDVSAADDLAQQIPWLDQVARRVDDAEQVQQYFQQLSELDQLSSPSEISALSIDNDQRLADACETMWRTWLQMQPSTLDQEARRRLGDYRALLEMIVQANERDEQVGGGVQQRFREMFPLITQVLPAWAITNLSARGRIPLEPAFFDVVVIDEASQCDIASALPLLYRAKRVVVIGDPQQLRHITQISSRMDQELMTREDILRDDLGPRWSYSQSSLFDLASSMVVGDDIVTLRDHHRSHADIINFSNDTFYEGRLRIATRYDSLRRPEGPAVRWIDVRGKVQRPFAGSAFNDAEARQVVDEIRRLLLEQCYSGTIGVVTPFREQANKIRDLVEQDDELSPVRGSSDLLIETVYRFQGDERDVMLFSPVVSEDAPSSTMGFLRANPNTFNVAVTRARAALIAVGDLSVCANCDVNYLTRFAKYCSGQWRHEETIRDLSEDLGPQYPAVHRPERVSPWERTFYELLYRDGLRPIPQFEVEQYALDFALFAGDRRLDIEIDGEHYHRAWDGGNVRSDQIRSRRLIELGWDVMRFWVYQVRDEPERCLERVRRWQSRHATN